MSVELQHSVFVEPVVSPEGSSATDTVKKFGKGSLCDRLEKRWEEKEPLLGEKPLGSPHIMAMGAF